MKPAREPASSRPKALCILEKAPRILPVRRSLLALVGRKQTWSDISFSLRNLTARVFLYFGLATWIQPSHPASPHPSSVPGANLTLAHGLLSSLPLSAAVHAGFGAMTIGTNGLACGFNWQCTANDIGYAVSWPQHALDSLPSPHLQGLDPPLGREAAARAGQRC